MSQTLSKKILPLIAAVILAFGICTSASAATITSNDISSASAVLIDLDSGSTIFQKNAQEQRAPASTTKLLTIVTALDNGLQLTDKIYISAVSAAIYGSKMGLVEGERVTTEDLIRGILLTSGNDAAMAIAREVSNLKTGAASESAFVKLMNDKAAEIGMTNSKFVNCTGLDTDGHYSTAEDMAKLIKYSYDKYPYLLEYAKDSTYQLSATNMQNARTLVNRNLLVYNAEAVAATASPDALSSLTPNDEALASASAGTNPYYYEYATGLKTGSTANAGNCILATASKDNKNLAVCILGDTSAAGTARWEESKALFEYGFSLKSFTLTEVAQLVGSSATIGESTVNVVPENGDSSSVLLPEDVTAADITCTVTPSEGITSVTEGTVVGTAVYTLGDTTLYEGNVVAAAAAGGDQTTAQPVPSVEANSSDAVSPINTVDVNKTQNDGGSRFPWIWVIIPAVIIIIIIIRVVLVNTRRGRRYSRRRSRSRGRRYKF